jgi:hypothetical protein
MKKSIIHLLVSNTISRFLLRANKGHKLFFPYFLFDLKFGFSTLTISQRTFNQKKPNKDIGWIENLVTPPPPSFLLVVGMWTSKLRQP